MKACLSLLRDTLTPTRIPTTESKDLCICLELKFLVALFPGPSQLSDTCYCKRQEAGWGQEAGGKRLIPISREG